MKSQLVAISIGHSRFIGDRREGGAVSAGGISEWAFNRDMGARVHHILARDHGVASFLIDEHPGASYAAAMRNVAKYINSRACFLAIELHFNAFDGIARGHEWLFWKGSVRGEAFAANLDAAFEAAALGIPRRGIKPKTFTDRGALFLRSVNPPAVIAEPFFGDNPADWKIAISRKADIANALALAIVNSLP